MLDPKPYIIIYLTSILKPEINGIFFFEISIKRDLSSLNHLSLITKTPTRKIFAFD